MGDCLAVRGRSAWLLNVRRLARHASAKCLRSLSPQSFNLNLDIIRAPISQIIQTVHCSVNVTGPHR